MVGASADDGDTTKPEIDQERRWMLLMEHMFVNGKQPAHAVYPAVDNGLGARVGSR